MPEASTDMPSEVSPESRAEPRRWPAWFFPLPGVGDEVAVHTRRGVETIEVLSVSAARGAGANTNLPRCVRVISFLA
jgi:hypothetical protein